MALKQSTSHSESKLFDLTASKLVNTNHESRITFKFYLIANSILKMDYKNWFGNLSDQFQAVEGREQEERIDQIIKVNQDLLE